MSVTTVLETWQVRRGSSDSKAGRSYTRVFEAHTDSDADDVPDILGASAVPKVGESHPRDPGAICKKVDAAAQSASKRHWLAIAEYSSELDNEGGADGGQSPSNPNQNPVERLPVWTFDTVKMVRYVYQDIFGVPYINKAGDPLPAQEEEYSILEATAHLQAIDFDPVQAAKVCWTINNAPWSRWNFDTYTALLSSIQAKEAFANAFWFWDIYYKALINPDGWRPYRVLNAGFNELALVTGSSDRQKRRILDFYGQPVSEPQLLDEFGGKLAAGADPVFLEFDRFRFSTFPDVQ